MLDGAAGFLEHDVSQAGVVGRGRAVGDGEVLARVVAVQEYGDVVYPAGAVTGQLVRQRQLAVRGYIQGYLKELWRRVLVAANSRR